LWFAATELVRYFNATAGGPEWSRSLEPSPKRRPGEKKMDATEIILVAALIALVIVSAILKYVHAVEDLMKELDEWNSGKSE
jgi:hypothetical protein